jgi:hypothetical protein
MCERDYIGAGEPSHGTQVLILLELPRFFAAMAALILSNRARAV